MKFSDFFSFLKIVQNFLSPLFLTKISKAPLFVTDFLQNSMAPWSGWRSMILRIRQDWLYTRRWFQQIQFLRGVQSDFNYPVHDFSWLYQVQFSPTYILHRGWPFSIRSREHNICNAFTCYVCCDKTFLFTLVGDCNHWQGLIICFDYHKNWKGVKHCLRWWFWTYFQP